MTFTDSPILSMVGDDVREFAALQGRETAGLSLKQQDFCHTKCLGGLAMKTRPPKIGRIACCPGTSASEQ